VRALTARLAIALLIFGSLTFLGACKEEGTVRVSRLKFNGVHAVKVSQLRSVLATLRSSRLPWGTKHYFQRQQFDADLKRIAAFYHDRGYPDAKVSSFDVKLNDKQDAVDITINIDEGKPILVEQIEYIGFDVIPARHLSALKGRIALKTNAPLDRALAQATREAALDEVRDHGYPYASVRLTEREGSNDHARILTLSATPGTLARYGQIEINGNHSVTDHVIQRQLTFRPNMRYSLSQVQESQRRLYDLGTFQFANIVPDVPEGQQPDVVPIKVTVTEAKPHKVTLEPATAAKRRCARPRTGRHSTGTAAPGTSRCAPDTRGSAAACVRIFASRICSARTTTCSRAASGGTTRSPPIRSTPKADA